MPGHAGLCPQQDVFLVQLRGEPRRVSREREGQWAEFHLNGQEPQGLKHRKVLELLEAGGNIYYLAKWAGIFGLNVQQIGAQQRGMTEDEFKELLVRAGGD